MPKRKTTKKILIALEREDLRLLKHIQDEFSAVSMTEAVRLSLRYMARFTSNVRFWEWASEAGLLLPTSARIKRAENTPPVDSLR
jgi:hypothetical protein